MNSRDIAFYGFVAAFFLISVVLIVFGAYVVFTLHANVQTITNPYIAILWPLGLVTLIAGIPVLAGVFLELHIKQLEKKTEASVSELKELRKSINALTAPLFQVFQSLFPAPSPSAPPNQPSPQGSQTGQPTLVQ